MDLSIKAQLQLLKHYLTALPKALPLSPPTSSLNKLLNFSLDQEWVLEIGEEHAGRDNDEEDYFWKRGCQ